MAAPALDIDREALRVLVIAVGPREAARQTGINPNTVLALSKRHQWLTVTQPTPAQSPLPKSMQPIAINAINSGDAMLNVLKRKGIHTKLCIATAAHKMAAQAAKDPKLANANDLHSVAKTAGLIYGWESKAPAAQVMVNLSILGL